MLSSTQANGSWSSLGALAFLGALSLVSAGCVDPDGKFDDFATRYDQDNATSTAPIDAGPCPPTKVGEADGDYFLSLSAKINRKKPVVFLTKLTTQTAGTGLTFKLDVQPLMVSDHRTPTGMSYALGPFPLAADGSFTAALPTLTVPANGNPIITADLEATVTLIGHICGKGEFICGEVTGNVAKPIPIADLTTSTFTMQRITDPAKYPTPLLDCAKNTP